MAVERALRSQVVEAASDAALEWWSRSRCRRVEK